MKWLENLYTSFYAAYLAFRAVYFYTRNCSEESEPFEATIKVKPIRRRTQ